MQKLIRAARTAILSVASLVLVAGYPLAAFAEDAPATSPTPTTTTDTTKTTTPPPPPKPTYIYNKETGRWDSNKWVYDPASGTYKAVTPPAPAPTITETAPASAETTPTVVTPDSMPTNQTSTTGTTDATNKSGATSTQNSDATSGNATVDHNVTAGDATSGDAAATTTILNNVNSTISTANNQKAASFVSDVMGDVHGDIVLQPMMLKAMLEAGASGATNVTNTSSLTNDINLNATSGDASVTGNTTAGNATTGSATTVANVMNIINSMVAANQSFVGTINIYGSLDGDILIAPDFIPQLIASNKDLAATNVTAPSTVSANDTQSIVNNVALAAQSGQAAVTGNTTGGNATTGDANTNVVIFNLSGHQIVASNSLLVFVNVLGKWVGVIVDAPTGATAAAIGNGVTSDTTIAPDLAVQVQNNTQLTNNINLNSQSGNALVAHNTTGGDATSGNATASANIANVSNSTFGLSSWFGVLFINVFGSWTGSFGVDTTAGNQLTPTSGGTGSDGNSPAKRPLRVIDFIPHAASPAFQRTAAQATVVTPSGGVSSDNDNGNAVLAAATGSDSDSSNGGNLTPFEETPANDFRLPMLVGSTFLIAVSLAGLKRLPLRAKRGSEL